MGQDEEELQEALGFSTPAGCGIVGCDTPVSLDAERNPIFMQADGQVFSVLCCQRHSKLILTELGAEETKRMDDRRKRAERIDNDEAARAERAYNLIKGERFDGEDDEAMEDIAPPVTGWNTPVTGAAGHLHSGEPARLVESEVTYDPDGSFRVAWSRDE